MTSLDQSEKVVLPNSSAATDRDRNGEEVVFVQERDENTFIENVIAKLKSVKDQERENGCDNLCIAADHHVSSIIETGLLRILGPLLADPNHNVRRAAVGALKNLSLSSEDPDRNCPRANEG
ncbi:CTNND1 [Lepeophtheirus salmonis]|uniref:CTNND1 n=1 Tax=Lepeophtheirus salmonis TaxID=72036 RepID=A0A7R8CH55_LEPSM|nr:CTNND1 [Lepeophtheirus salmonis]CAF2776822.1 CTNND1 [Lepeophtheirus salmonis]